MRPISRLGCALMLTAFHSTIAAAQQANVPFENSWYWGAGAGRLSFPSYYHRLTTPMYGFDWLITRNRWALDVFAAESRFTDITRIADPNPSGFRDVKFENMRRAGFQGLVFLPTPRPWFRPYAGFGFSFNFITKAAPNGGGFTNVAQLDSAQTRINDARTLAKATYAVGVMAPWRRFAPYAQYTLMPTKGSSGWLINGEGVSSFWEVGLRYNFGNAVEKIR